MSSLFRVAVLVLVLSSCGTATSRSLLYNASVATVSTYAGDGAAADGGTSLADASFYTPAGVTCDNEDSALYVLDYYAGTVRTIHMKSGAVDTLASLGTLSYPYLAALYGGSLYVAYTNGVMRVPLDGSTPTTFGSFGTTANGIAITSSGTVYISNATGTIYEASIPLGTPFAPVNITNLTLQNVIGLAVNSLGTLYACDLGRYQILKIEFNGKDGTAQVVAGTGTPGYVDGSTNQAQFVVPAGITLAADGSIFITEQDGSHSTIRKIAADGMVTTVAGKPGAPENFADGVGQQALFGRPLGLTFDSSGNLYVGDGDNQKVRKITFSKFIN